MRTIHRPSIFVLLLLLAGLYPHGARAETYSTCTGFIESVPTVISTQGVWCLRKDVSTAVTSGAAITVNTNNVTIDCNGYKIGGLAAGNGSMTSGIYANNRQNTTIRECNVRGFRVGIDLGGYGGGGHLVENNRVDNSLASGISVLGGRNLVQHNRVFDTGGAEIPFTYAIKVGGDAIDNQIDGVFSAATTIGNVYGIALDNSAGMAGDNQIYNLVPKGNGGAAYGITGILNATRAVDNHVAASAYSVVNGDGINSIRACQDNAVSHFSTNYNCSLNSGNL